MDISKFDLFVMMSHERRACKLIWRKYRVNRFEVALLALFWSFLALKGKRVSGLGYFQQWVGAGIKEGKKMQLTFEGMAEAGLLSRHEIRRRDRVTVGYGVSGYGDKLLTDYHLEAERLLRQITPKGRDMGYQVVSPGRDS